MINRFLGEYKSFKCIADKCPDTCCKGWAVEIDVKSLEKYDSLNLSGVDFSEETFRLKSNMDCYYLNSKGLCDLYLEHGEGIFCRTCDMYPRHIEEFPNTREHSLSISCPVVAMDFVDLNKDVLSIHEFDDKEVDTDDYEDFDFELFSSLLNCRKDFFVELCKPITYNHLDDLNTALKKILAKASKLQCEYDGYDADSYIPDLNIYDTNYALFIIDTFLSLEPLNANFRNYVKSCCSKIQNEQNIYSKIDSFINANPSIPDILRRIVFYFIYTYFCGAAYDEYIYGMAAVSVFSSLMILYLLVFSPTEEQIKMSKGTDDCFLQRGTGGYTLSDDCIAKIIYSYSRELEHSTENMILLEQLLENNRL